MHFKKFISTIESHTAGMPTRVVYSGIPPIHGKTMKDKQEYFSKKFGHLRNVLMHEPRGHGSMFGAILTSPCSPEADFGAIFMSTTKYLDMCGHASIGIITVLIECGFVEHIEPYTKIVLDTPAGLITGYAKVNKEKVEEVTIRNVPAFFYLSKEISVPKIGTINVDIAFGGNFYAIVNASDIGLTVETKNAYKISEAAMIIKKLVNSEIKVSHPKKQNINKVNFVLIYDKPTHPEAHAKNVVVSAKARQDRSPCGTGTCARMATLWSKNELKLNEEFINESIIGTNFRGRLVSEVSVGDLKAAIPEITSSAFITGFSNYVIDPSDPLGSGFLLT
ncbi:MAG: proline racemase family protein [Deltaproteobacteria bacterium]|nr:proline racemase family protein [Deltaproteobacteria bacterium]